jgi:hypothetical protein
MCQNIAYSLRGAVGRFAIITDIPKALYSVSHDRLLMKMAASSVDSSVVVWVREFIVGCTQRVKLGVQISKLVKVPSGVPQGSVLAPLPFLLYVNGIWRNIGTSIRLFADGCIMYREITNKNDRGFVEECGHLEGMGGRKWDENKSR